MMHSFFQPKIPPPAAASSFERYTGYLSDMSDDGDFDSNSDDERLGGDQGDDVESQTSMSRTARPAVHPPQERRKLDVPY